MNSTVERLLPYRDAIGGGADRQRVSFALDTWREWLREAGWSDDAIRLVVERFDDGTVTRQQLRDLGGEVDDHASRARLLVATLIWGRGKRNGRMRRHIVDVLKHDGLERVLKDTAYHSANGEPAKAYAAWQLPGLREAFVTKWLWAASYTGDPARRCLVLDANVWKTLNEIEWSSVTAAGTRARPLRYEAYIDACHRWAGQVGPGVSPEDIEWALFCANGNLEELHSARCS